MTMKKSAVLILLLLTPSLAASAQSTRVSLGPQIGGFGIGASASARIGDYFSVSGEVGVLPLANFNDEVDDIAYVLDPNVNGVILGVHVHPFRGKFSVGAGIVLGTYAANVESEQVTGSVEVGDVIYDAVDVGTMIGDFELTGAWPALMIGWRGKGVNFGLGVAFVENPTVDIRATGPISNDPIFQSELRRETDNIEDDLQISVIPLIRIAYQFEVVNR